MDKDLLMSAEYWIEGQKLKNKISGESNLTWGAWQSRGAQFQQFEIGSSVTGLFPARPALHCVLTLAVLNPLNIVWVCA